MTEGARKRYLAAEGAESEGIKETAATNLASISDAFARPRLRALI